MKKNLWLQQAADVDDATVIILLTMFETHVEKALREGFTRCTFPVHDEKTMVENERVINTVHYKIAIWLRNEETLSDGEKFYLQVNFFPVVNGILAKIQQEFITKITRDQNLN